MRKRILTDMHQKKTSNFERSFASNLLKRFIVLLCKLMNFSFCDNRLFIWDVIKLASLLIQILWKSVCEL